MYKDCVVLFLSLMLVISLFFCEEEENKQSMAGMLQEKIVSFK